MEEIRKIASDLGNRIKGTYGATFVLVWFVYNWRLIYIVLSFDKSYSLSHKLEVLNRYLAHDKGHCNTFWYPLGMSVISIIVYYVMNYLTFAISAIFNLKLKPWIQGKIDKLKSTLVSKEHHNKLLNLNNELKKELEIEKSKNIEETSELKKIKQDYKQLSIEHTNLNVTKENLEKQNEDELFKIRAFYENKIQKLESESGFLVLETSEIFNDFWKNKYYHFFKSKENGEEIFKVEKDQIIINNEPIFTISNFQKNERFIKFTKKSNINNRVIDSYLIIVSPILLIGFECDNSEFYHVEYNKVPEIEYLNNLNKVSNTNKKLNL